MIRILLSRYKFPLFLSLIFSVIALALRLESNILNALYFALGSLFGVVFLDLDYVLFSYVTEPDHYFSKEFKVLLRQLKLNGLFTYVDTHKSELGNLVLHSALFQVILAIMAFYVVSSTGNIFVKALTMSAFIQSFYRQYLDYEKERNLDHWFWILTDKPKKNFLTWYFLVLGALFLYSFSILV